MAYGDLIYGDGQYKGLGAVSYEQPVDILTDEGKTCLILGLENDHGGGWSQRDGENWIWPSSIASLTQLFDRYQQMFEVGLCPGDGLFYVLNPMDGVDMDLPYRDKVDPLVFDSGFDIESDVFLGEVTGEMRHYKVYDLESHLQFRPVNPDNVGAAGYDSIGLPNGFSLEVFTRQDGLSTEVSRVTDIPVHEDIVQERVVNGNSHQLCLHVSHSAFKLMAVEQYCKIHDKPSSHDNGGLGTSEEQMQKELSRPVLWLSRGRLLLLNRATGRVIDGSVVPCVGVDGRSGSGFDVQDGGIELSNAFISSGTLMFWRNYYGSGEFALLSDSMTWTLRASAADNSWESVCYGNGLFVAVSSSGTGNRVMTSPDGITWTSRVGAADNTWRSVCYGNGLFVAVSSSGTGNRVMTSPDGITWTSRASAADNEWYSVCYGNGLFVAVSNTGAGNQVMTSPDGITWTTRANAANRQWRSVCYGNGLFVAVAFAGTGNRVMTSPDGITWTSRASAANSAWHSVCYGDGLFVAVSIAGTGNRVMTSPDGITWTLRASAADNSWYSVCYGNGLFVAVAFGGTGGLVMTSPDGITWTSRASAANSAWHSVCYGDGLFVAVSIAGTGNRVMTAEYYVIEETIIPGLDNPDGYVFSYVKGALPARLSLPAECKYFDVRLFDGNISLDAIQYYCGNVIHHSGDIFLP